MALKPLQPPKGSLFFENFQDDDWQSRWKVTANEKYAGIWEVKEVLPNGERALVIPQAGYHYGIMRVLDSEITSSDKAPLCIQYDVRFAGGATCGGAYIKLLTASPDLKNQMIDSSTPYTIMFGPDKCGEDNNKVHFIFRHQNPLTKQFEEKHLMDPPEAETDDKTHTYSICIHPNNNLTFYLDSELDMFADLLSSFNPPVNPPEEIPDPDDIKPADWDDRPTIPDPNAKKPGDWDENTPETIPDPDAKPPSGWLANEPSVIADPAASKPDEWNDEEDGTWEPPTLPNPVCTVGCGKWNPPQIPNPKYKGKWQPPAIPNPNYRGEWKPKMLPNPDYFFDAHPHRMTPIGAVGIEVWSLNEDVQFDNILITHSNKSIHEFTRKNLKARQAEEERVATEAMLEAQRQRDEADGWVLAFVKKWTEIGVRFVQGNVVALVLGSLVVFLIPLGYALWSNQGEHRHHHSDDEDEDETSQHYDKTEAKKESDATRGKAEPKKQHNKARKKVAKVD